LALISHYSAVIFKISHKSVNFDAFFLLHHTVVVKTAAFLGKYEVELSYKVDVLSVHLDKDLLGLIMGCKWFGKGFLPIQKNKLRL